MWIWKLKNKIKIFLFRNNDIKQKILCIGISTSYWVTMYLSYLKESRHFVRYLYGNE